MALNVEVYDAVRVVENTKLIPAPKNWEQLNAAERKIVEEVIYALLTERGVENLGQLGSKKASFYPKMSSKF